MIERAVLDAFDSASYLATLRYAGSPSTAVAGVPVSRAIPAAALVPGRRVAVALFGASHPLDAMVVGVH